MPPLYLLRSQGYNTMVMLHADVFTMPQIAVIFVNLGFNFSMKEIICVIKLILVLQYEKHNKIVDREQT